MFPRLLVVFFVEAANKLLENRPHTVIVKTGCFQDSFFLVFVDGIGREIYVRGDKFFDNCSQNISFNHSVYLIAELKLVQNLLHIGGEAVQIAFKIRL